MKTYAVTVSTIREAASAIAEDTEKLWPGWLVRVLQETETAVRDEGLSYYQYEVALQELRDRIDSRLETGEW